MGIPKASALVASSAFGARGTGGLSKDDESDGNSTDDESNQCYACGESCKGKCHKKCPAVLAALIADIEKLCPVAHPDKENLLRKMKNPKTREDKAFRFQKMNEAAAVPSDPGHR